MGLTKNITKQIIEYWNNGMLIKKIIVKSLNPFFYFSIIPIKLNQNTKKTFYNYNRKN